jgi:hypothetical protein
MRRDRIGRLLLTLITVASMGCPLARAGDPGGDGAEVRLAPTRHPGGIWKASVPPVGMKAEFDGHDPIGLASGAVIKADCSLNWIDPDTGKLYCFSSATSQSYFQDWPKRNIERAARQWQARSAGGS